MSATTNFTCPCKQSCSSSDDDVYANLEMGPTRLYVRRQMVGPSPEPIIQEPVPLRKHRPIVHHPSKKREQTPSFEFVDEKWRRQQIEMQQFYKEQMKEKLMFMGASRFGTLTVAHKRLLEYVGPTWFQDLSPKQLTVIEQVASSIALDHKHNTYTRTQAKIAELGLVLRPNRLKIRMALEYCNQDPVEFLLILQKLLHTQNSSNYTINERLLLSGVAHLTLKSTLRELHVRLPSPPPPPSPEESLANSIVTAGTAASTTNSSESSKKRKKRTYPSPYLEPFTYKPEPRKFRGIYKKNYRQNAVSPYFDYIRDLKKPSVNETVLDPADDTDLEIAEEVKNAEDYFRTMYNMSHVTLLKPSRCQRQQIDYDSILSEFQRRSTRTKKTPSNVNELYYNEILKNSCSAGVTPCLLEQSVDETPPQTPSNHSLENTEESVEIIQKSISVVSPEPEPEHITTVTPAEPEPEPDPSVKKPYCECGDERTTLMRDYMKRKKAVAHLRTLPDNYVIGGVINTAEGPIFHIQSVIFEPPCTCIKHVQSQYDSNVLLSEATYRRGAELKSKPDSYMIGGVVNTTDGAIYQISGVSQYPPCQCCQMSNGCHCLALYRKFERKHATCMELYENYVRQMQKKVHQFQEELEWEEKQRVEYLKEKTPESEPEEIETEVEQEQKNTILIGEEPPHAVHAIVPVEEPKPKTNNEDKIVLEPVRKEPSPPEPANDVVTCELSTFQRCQCHPNVNPIHFKRFFLMPELPRRYQKQIRIIKELLDSLAEDGYPLAQLPDVQKLPHFKLWMNMRRRRCWTNSDQDKYIGKSTKFWAHTNKCNRLVPLPKISISNEEAAEMTWAQSKFARKLISDYREEYYRKTKQKYINYGREVLPTMFTHEFPNETFRNVYFAYMPAREEECFLTRMWQPYEIKDFSRRKSCLTKFSK